MTAMIAIGAGLAYAGIAVIGGPVGIAVAVGFAAIGVASAGGISIAANKEDQPLVLLRTPTPTQPQTPAPETPLRRSEMDPEDLRVSRSRDSILSASISSHGSSDDKPGAHRRYGSDYDPFANSRSSISSGSSHRGSVLSSNPDSDNEDTPSSNKPSKK